MNRDHETQHLLQQQYNSLDKPFYHSSMAIDDNSYKPTSIMQFNDLTKSKRRQVKNACVNCQKACKKCDDGRPCQRCIKYNLTETCQDSIRKERKKGVKRGPYKRISGNQNKTITKKMLKSQNVSRVTYVPTSIPDNVVMSSETVYPQKSPAMLPKHGKCIQTSVTPPPPPIAICSSQNNHLSVSPPYYFNQSNPIVYNNSGVINNYHQYAKTNNGVNMMPSPRNYSLVMPSNDSSPQQQCLPVSMENNFSGMFSFCNNNNMVQHSDQNELNIYRTPINSSAMYSTDNPIMGPGLVIDLPPFSKGIYHG